MASTHQTSKSDSQSESTITATKADTPGAILQPRAPGVILPQAHANPTTLMPPDVLQLQRAGGNRAVSQMFSGQQTATPIQPKLTLGPVNDRYEQEADNVAKRVAGQVQRQATYGNHSTSRRGVYTLPTIQPVSQTNSRVQRFESSEHKVMGDLGSKTKAGETRTVELAKDYFVSFGDITAMAGDFFKNVEQMKKLAEKDGKGKGTREEIEYVRVVKVHGKENKAKDFSDSAKKAVDDRYYELAGNNVSHFTEPRGSDKRTNILNNFGNYRDNHENAVKMAARAGAAKQSINEAMTQEAFASHFLTDAFSSGHIRTERLSISDWWNSKVPMFWHNLKLFIAEQMAYYVNDNTTIAGTFKTVQQLWESVREAFKKKKLPTMQFGDLVAGAVHDYDNAKGVATQHGTLVGDGQLRDEQGNPIINKATGKRVSGAAFTENKAAETVRISIEEIEKAYQLGATHAPKTVVTILRGGGMYTAEKLWPKAKPDKEQKDKRPMWKQPDVKTLLADKTMQEAIAIFAQNKARTLEEALTFDDEKVLGITVVSASLQARGFRERITGPLKSDPIKLLNRVINYTPNTGGGVGGHDTDDNALEYFQKAKAENGLGTLTKQQRLRLIRDMIRGVCGDEEEQAINDILAACSVSEMTDLVKSLGGGNARKGIDYLDSGIDWSEWKACKKILRRSPELAKLL